MLGKKFLVIPFTFLISASALSAPLSGNAEQGKMKAFTCQFCHGTNGVAKQPGYPNINGQNGIYLFNSMKAYQNGERSGVYAEMMKKQLSMMNDQDLTDIAAFYSKMQH